MKVYCKDCKYLGGSWPRCDYPDNIVLRDCSWYSPDEDKKGTKHDNVPQNLNKNNDCKWFVPKPTDGDD